MAVTNLQVLNPADKTKQMIETIGTGAIAATDVLVTEINKYPVGSRYFDTTGFVLYIRAVATAPAGALTDWKKTAQLT